MNKTDSKISKPMIIIPIAVFVTVLTVLIVVKQNQNKKDSSYTYTPTYTESYFYSTSSDKEYNIEGIDTDYIANYTCSIYDGYDEFKTMVGSIPEGTLVTAEKICENENNKMIYFDYDDYGYVWAYKIYFTEAQSLSQEYETETTTRIITTTAPTTTATIGNYVKMRPTEFIGMKLEDIIDIFGYGYSTDIYIEYTNAFMYYTDGSTDYIFWYDSPEPEFNKNYVVHAVECQSNVSERTIYGSYTNKATLSDLERYITDYEFFEAFHDVEIMVDGYCICYHFEENASSYDMAESVTIGRSEEY